MTLRTFVLCLPLLGASTAAAADPFRDFLFTPGKDRLQLQLATYVHYNDSDDYEGPPIYGGVQVNKASGWLYGLGLFNNSYGQFTQYLYFGRRIDVYRFGDYTAHGTLTGGLGHGYRGEHEDSLPVRIGDIGLVILPAVGVHWDRWSTDLVILYGEGLMFNVGFELGD